METRFLAARDVLAILGVVPRSRLKPQPLKHRRPHAPLHEPESFPVSLKSGFWRPASVISRARTGAQFYQPIEHRPQMRARVLARSEPCKPAVISLSHARAIGPRMLTNSTPRAAIGDLRRHGCQVRAR